MLIKIAALLVLLLVCLPLKMVGAQTIAGRYVVQKAIPVTASAGGTAGRLELVLDSRVKPGMSDAETSLFLPAKLQLVTATGTILQEKTLERSRAMLGSAPQIYGTQRIRPVYLLTVDYSADMGSYNGPITFFVEMARDKFVFASVQDKPLTVMRSLKTDWKFWPEKSRVGLPTDILEVACRPNSAQALGDNNADNDFVIVYRRYHWNGHKWTKRENQRIGFWEDDGHFPPIARFPAPLP